MLKKITTVISSNHKALARKAAVIGGVTLGIAIGVLLNKVEDDPDVVIVEELDDESSDLSTESDTPAVEE